MTATAPAELVSQVKDAISIYFEHSDTVFIRNEPSTVSETNIKMFDPLAPESPYRNQDALPATRIQRLVSETGSTRPDHIGNELRFL